MTIFSYKATTRDGEVLEGFIEAADEKSAVDRLKDTDLIPLKVTAPEAGLRKRFTLKPTRNDLLTLTTELSALLSAGLPLDRCLNILSSITEGRGMKETVNSVIRSIREGSSFSQALKKHPNVFPDLYVSMVSAGEAGGVLDSILEKLNDFLETGKELKDFILSSLIYPALLMITSGVSIIILLFYVIPRFSVIFDELGELLPLPTKVLLGFTGLLKAYWWALLLLVALFLVLSRYYVRTEPGKRRWDAIKLRLLGDIILKLETARFCRTLGTLIGSGVPMIEALESARGVVGNSVIRSALDGVARGVREGKGLAAPLSGITIFPSFALSLIQVGEETGQLDTMLLKVAGTYEKNLRLSVKRFMGLLEPALILGTGLVVGFIALSMFMAIFSIVEIPF